MPTGNLSVVSLRSRLGVVVLATPFRVVLATRFELDRRSATEAASTSKQRGAGGTRQCLGPFPRSHFQADPLRRPAVEQKSSLWK
jgi:hypothetical protein